jgi:hypothetical protein
MVMVEQNCWIHCHKYQKKVAGYYETDSSGRYLTDRFGKLIIQRTNCFEGNNSCPHSSCALNRNFRANGTFPSKVELFPN